MKVHELMTSVACAIEPETTIQQAAILMEQFIVGALPVLGGNHVMGIVTDRDLTIRGLAAGLPCDTPVGRIMSRGVHACHADEDVADVLLGMELLQLRHVPIEDGNDEFLGVVSLDDLAAVCPDTDIGRALKHIRCKQTCLPLPLEQPLAAA